MNLEYNIVYSARKTLQISVERDRSVIVRAPEGTPREKIQDAIESKKLWLYEKLKHPQKYQETATSKELVPGTSLLYLGKEYKLDFVGDVFDGVVFESKFLISRSAKPMAAQLLKAWYEESAKQIIRPRVKTFARQLGVVYNRVLISDLKYRWGSCTPKNNLNFNWRLVKAPMSVVEYVIVHELAHLLEPNHTLRFWGIIKAQLPHYLKAKEWLKERGELLEM
jgi:predicted metal-dependent hydrolase